MKKLTTSIEKAGTTDLICFSHLRWNFVFQRPQHLMTRVARDRRVFFFEEPVFHDGISPHLEVAPPQGNVFVATPHLPHGYSEMDINITMKRLLNGMLEDHSIARFVSWYYSPMHLKHSYHLQPIATVYDCMDQLANFKGAPQEIPLLEQSLMNKAQLVFTGGFSLFEAKRHLHPEVYPFPSSVDVAHFIQGRLIKEDPIDQRDIPHPRLGYAGVIDERIDLELLDAVATQRPDWHIVMVGPVVKIDPATLPKHPNIHYLGGKDYSQLPQYLGGWDVAILPFARNDATRYISPTKTPEYLAAGRRVISTTIRDVVHPYEDKKLVAIADAPNLFITKTETMLADSAGRDAWLARVDHFLEGISWDKTFNAMWQLVEEQMVERSAPAAIPQKMVLAQIETPW